MSENSAIEWTDATFNYVWGCTKVSPGCDFCYAERDSKRYWPKENLWGPGSTRRTFGENHWNEPLRYERRAVREGRRIKVFCSSMADVFDNHPVCAQERIKLWALIRQTPHLDWLLLTKRIGNAKSMLPIDWHDGFPNVWLGISVVNQEEADRDIPKLLALPATIHFLSCEPLLAPLTLNPWLLSEHGRHHIGAQPGISWVICGGESGHHARPMELEWARSLKCQCAEASVAFFMKQGSQANCAAFKDFESFPPSLQVRQWPK